MTTPTDTIGMNNVNTELGFSSTALISLNDAAVRNLANVPSGTISMNDLRGKTEFAISYPAAATGYFYGYDDCGGANTTVEAPSIVGGTGSYSYSWTLISVSVGFTISSTTVEQPWWSTYPLCNTTASETWRVGVTSGSQTLYADVYVELAYYHL